MLGRKNIKSPTRNYSLASPGQNAISAAVLQMSKSLNLTIVVAVGCILVGCAVEKTVIEKPMAAVETANSHLGRMSNVRTTAYTRKEEGGIKNALGTYLSGRHVMSAAADWSRFPLGTRFRICSTREEFIIDDYGTALVGTNTIDLYKPTKLEMKRWGVRVVDIDVLQWGSEENSLAVLGPRAKHPQVQSMLVALQKKTPSTRVAVDTEKASSKKADNKIASDKRASSKKSDKKIASGKKESSKKSDKKVASDKKESSTKSDNKVASDKKESSEKSEKKVASDKKESSTKSEKKVASDKEKSSKKSDEIVASSAKKSSTKSGKKVASSSNQSSAKPSKKTPID